jgi:RNA polymerase sigma-70 factor (ECF subfamily)
MIEALYRERYRRFLGFAVGMLGDRGLAHDAVQEAFARALVRRHELHGERTLAPWIWRVLTNVCRADPHSRARVSQRGHEDQAVAEAASSDEWPELRAAISALPERQRLAIYLRHYADLDYDAIAEVLDVKRGTVAATLHAAHTRLRTALAAQEVAQ